MSIPLTEYWALLATRLQSQRYRVLTLAILLLGSIGVQLIVPQVLRSFIDGIQAGASMRALIQIALTFLSVALLKYGLLLASNYANQLIGWTTTNALRADLVRHCLHLDMSFHNSHTPGELIERIDGDVSGLANFFSRLVIRALGSCLLLIGVLVALYLENWRVGVAFTIFSIVALALPYLMRDIATPHLKAERQATAELYGLIEERLAGTEDIRANGGTAYTMRRLFQVMRTVWRHAMTACVRIANSCFAIVAFILMLSIQPTLTLALFVPLILVVWLVQRLQSRIEALYKARQQSIGELTGALGEIFGAVQAIKVAGAEKSILAHFNKLNHLRGQAVMKDYLFTRLLDLFFDNISDLGAAALLLLAAQSMRTGEFTVGDFVLFVSFLPWITGTTGTVGMFIAAYKQVGVSLQRLRELLQGAPDSTLVRHRPVYLREPLLELPTPQPSSQPLQEVAVTGLTYRYPGSGQGIVDIDLHLKRGSLTVITGRVGSGKSTLLRALLGLLPKGAGEIRWNGDLVDDPATFFVPPQSAYTPQTPRLFSETLRDNILMGLPAGQTDLPVDLHGAIHQAILSTDVAAMPDGLETMIGPRGVRLSGGQVQRTAAARMFVHRPELLVFDDLSSALDVDTEQLLWERLFATESTRGAQPTCLVVSHRQTVLQRADHIIVLKDGHVADEGTLAELLVGSEEMQSLWHTEK